MIENRIAVSVVVPVYKEESNIKPFLQRTEAVMKGIGVSYEIIFSLDPSPDRTEEVIITEINRNPNIKLLVFSRRFGQPAATMAGIFACKGESCVIIDVDLQDQPELIENMYKKLSEGFEVVYARRRSRIGETLLKKIISYIGYVAINKLSEVSIPRNTGDFRIITRRVIEELRMLNESHGFLRGLVSFVGFRQTFIEYDRDTRYSGSGNYNKLTGSFKIGLNGLVSFSSKPLQLMSIFGFLLAGLSFIMGFYVVISKIFWNNYVEGFTSLALLISYLAGMQFLCLGLMGEYISRIYDEVKQRPLFIIDKKIGI